MKNEQKNEQELVDDFELAEVIFSAWFLGEGYKQTIPVCGNFLDHALWENKGLFPVRFQKGLDFNRDKKCVNIASILDAAEYSMVIQTNGSDFLTARYLGTQEGAKQIVVENGLTVLQATEIGTALKKSVQEFESSLKEI